MTWSLIRDSSLPTLKIGHSIESILIEVIIVAECASMLTDYPFFKGEQLDLHEILFQRGVFIWCMGEKLVWYDSVHLRLSLIIHVAQDSPNHQRQIMKMKICGLVEEFNKDMWVVLKISSKYWCRLCNSWWLSKSCQEF